MDFRISIFGTLPDPGLRRLRQSSGVVRRCSMSPGSSGSGRDAGLEGPQRLDRMAPVIEKYGALIDLVVEALVREMQQEPKTEPPETSANVRAANRQFEVLGHGESIAIIQ